MASCAPDGTAACLSQQHTEQVSQGAMEAEEEEDLDSAAQRRRRRQRRGHRLHIADLSDDEEEQITSSTGTAEAAAACALPSPVGSSREPEVEATSLSQHDGTVDCLRTDPQHIKKRRRLGRIVVSESGSPVSMGKETADAAVKNVDFPERGFSADTAKVEAWRAAGVERTEPSPPPTTERPLTPVDRLALTTAAQREGYFADLVQKEMRHHGLLPKWRIAYDNCRTQAGSCRYDTKTLSFARGLIHRASPEEQRQAVLHEIAHALTGRGHNHDQVWRAVALKIGCDGRRCHDLTLADPTWRFSCTGGCWSRLCYKRAFVRQSPSCSRCGAACTYERL